MALTEKKLGQSTINSSEETIYQCPASTTGIVKTIWLANVTATDVTVDLWNPTSGVTTSDNVQLLDTFTIPANDFMQISTYIILKNAGTGDSIVAKCSTANAVSCAVYGAELT